MRERGRFLRFMFPPRLLFHPDEHIRMLRENRAFFLCGGESNHRAGTNHWEIQRWFERWEPLGLRNPHLGCAIRRGKAPA
jgi:hypothetical protein